MYSYDTVLRMVETPASSWGTFQAVAYFGGGVDVETPSQEERIVGHYPHGMPLHPSKPHGDVLGPVRHDLEVCFVIHYLPTSGSPRNLDGEINSRNKNRNRNSSNSNSNNNATNVSNLDDSAYKQRRPSEVQIEP